MESRQRFRAALRRQPVDRLPLWDIEFHAWSRFGHGIPRFGTDFRALAAAERTAALRRNAEIIALVAVELGMDAVSAPAPWWEDGPGHPAHYILPEGWDEAQADALVEAAHGRFAVVGNASGVPCARYDVDFCARLVEDPASVEAEHESMLEYGVARVRRLAAAGCDAVFSASDLADNHGPFFRSGHLARFVLPYLRRWVRAVHAEGLEAILHSDGDMRPMLGDIAHSGIDALQAIDPTAGMSLPAALAQVGDRLCLCGNVDCALLLNGTPQQVESETAALITACRGRGSWILGCSNAVLPETPAENYRAMVRAMRCPQEIAHVA